MMCKEASASRQEELPADAKLLPTYTSWKKRIKGRGFSLLEVLCAFVIILLVCLYTMSSFASGQQHYLRAQELSIATSLAHSQLEQFLVQPLAEINPVTSANVSLANVTAAAGYTYSLTLTPYQSPDGVYSDLTELDLTVRSPLGALAKVSVLKGREATPQGAACDPDTNSVAFWDSNLLRYCNDDNASASITLSVPESGEGSVAGTPGFGLTWAVNSIGGLSKWVESPTGTSGAWTNIGIPTITGFTTNPIFPRLSGVAGNNFGSEVFVGDASDRCLWSCTDASPAVWTKLQPTTPALGAPSAVACDPYGSMVWVADAENQCLRKYIVGATSPYPSGYAVADGNGFWLTVQYHPPATMGMGVPLGMAMDAYSNTLYVIDGARLYTFIDDPNPAHIGSNKGTGGPGTWTVVNLDRSIVGAQPCGIAGDFVDNILFINCRGNPATTPNMPQLWKLKLPNTATLRWG